MIDIRHEVSWEADHPGEHTHFQKLITKGLFVDTNAHGMDIEEED